MEVPSLDGGRSEVSAIRRRIEDALDVVGPDAGFRELDALGLSRWPPSMLRYLFQAAMKENRQERARLFQNALWKHPVGITPRGSRSVPLMAWNNMPALPRSGQHYLFVSGVARSGTTALGLLLGKHPDVAMYIELYESTNGYLPGMLAKANIEHLVERGILKPEKAAAAILEKSEKCKFVGDKRPGFMHSAELTFRNFETGRITVVHVVRNIYEVAASYQRRLDAGTWMRDFRAAVHDANFNNSAALKLLRTEYKDNIVIVDYNRFWQSSRNIDALIVRIGLCEDAMDHHAVELFLTKAQEVVSRSNTLTDAQRAFVVENYDMGAEVELKSMADSFSWGH